MNKTSYQIAEKAVNIFKIHATENDFKIELATNKQGNYANNFSINITHKTNVYQFTTLVKKELIGNASLAMLKAELSHIQNLLIISEYISKEIATFFRINLISYLDTYGNIYLHRNQLLIFINSGKNRKNKISYGIAFEKTGLKLLFYFLQKPDFLQNTYAQMAKQAGISTGSISKIIASLKHGGYYYQKNGRRIIRNRKELLAQWVKGYERKLYLENLIGKYRTNLANYQLPKQVYWGGEVATELLNLNLKGQNKTLYTSINPIEVVKKLRLIPADNGDVELHEIFWNTEIIKMTDLNTVPEIIIYANLIISNNSRNIEIANELYERYIQNFK
ncbi:MAG: hypothetical protein HN692_00480 [Candidatus Cloacimonetes bacterium]|nr:hypothetical protein [Candidatus Cloacimonadota bacterium]